MNMPTPVEYCDAAYARLTSDGWSVIMYGIVRPTGTVQTVDVVKGYRRVIVHAPTRAEAYRQVIKLI